MTTDGREKRVWIFLRGDHTSPIYAGPGATVHRLAREMGKLEEIQIIPPLIPEIVANPDAAGEWLRIATGFKDGKVEIETIRIDAIDRVLLEDVAKEDAPEDEE